MWNLGHLRAPYEDLSLIFEMICSSKIKMRNFEALMSLNPTQEPEVQMCLTPRYHAPSIQRLLKLYFAPLSRVPRPRLCVIIQVSILES